MLQKERHCTSNYFSLHEKSIPPRPCRQLEADLRYRPTRYAQRRPPPWAWTRSCSSAEGVSEVDTFYFKRKKMPHLLLLRTERSSNGGWRRHSLLHRLHVVVSVDHVGQTTPVASGFAHLSIFYEYFWAKTKLFTCAHPIFPCSLPRRTQWVKRRWTLKYF